MAPLLGQAPQEDSARALQNPFLRQIFRQEYLTLHSQSPRGRFLETYVDRRIDRFLKNSRKSMGELKSAFSECRRLQRSLSQGGGNLSPSPVLVESLLSVGEKAGRLRKQLSLVLPPTLRNRSDLDPAQQIQGQNGGWGSAMEEISRRIELVERHLESYFFNGLPVVEVENLGDRDILVLLYEIRKFSRLARAPESAARRP